MQLDQKLGRERRQIKISILAECYTNECLGMALCEELKESGLEYITKHKHVYSMAKVVGRFVELCKKLRVSEHLVALADYKPNSFDREYIDRHTFNDRVISKGIRIRQIRCDRRAYTILFNPGIEKVLAESREFKSKLGNPRFQRELKSREICEKYGNLFRGYIGGDRALVDKVIELILGGYR